LVEGLRNEVIVRDTAAQYIFPGIKPVDFATAVRWALNVLESGQLETRWTDALASSLGNRSPVTLTTLEGLILERRQTTVQALPEKVFAAFSQLGGDVGWLYFEWAWKLRGLMDRLIGGVGLRRGRRDPLAVRVGDALDFWRVETVEPNKLLRLRAEMKVPGLAWLQFEARPLEGGDTQLVQTAYFAPKGLGGFLYWYGLYPLHRLIFSGMIRELRKMAENQ
jgi:hypothetical protein